MRAQPCDAARRPAGEGVHRSHAPHGGRPGGNTAGRSEIIAGGVRRRRAGMHPMCGRNVVICARDARVEAVEDGRARGRDPGVDRAPELAREGHVDRTVAELRVEAADDVAARARELVLHLPRRRGHDDPRPRDRDADHQAAALVRRARLADAARAPCATQRDATTSARLTAPSGTRAPTAPPPTSRNSRRAGGEVVGDLALLLARPELRAELLVDLLQARRGRRREELRRRTRARSCRALGGFGGHARDLRVAADERALDRAVRRPEHDGVDGRASARARRAAAGAWTRPTVARRRRRRRSPRAAALSLRWPARRAEVDARAGSRRRSPCPRPGRSDASPCSNAFRSRSAGTTGIARPANDTRPTRNFSGTSRDERARGSARGHEPRRRDVLRPIERETSIASTIVASSRGTETVACGRATPTSIAESASRSSASGTWRRRPARRGTRFGSSAGFANRVAKRCAGARAET